MSIAVLFLTAALLDGSTVQSSPRQSQQPTRPTPSPTTEYIRSGLTMHRFMPMNHRDMLDRTRRENHRQNVIVERQLLAERLDQLIGSGRCDEALLVAGGFGYRDIAQVVSRTCETRAVSASASSQ